MKRWTTRDLTAMAMLAALVCVLTFTVKIPVPATNGYTHLGDCMIFLGVLLLGWRKALPAAAIGAAMSDLLGGYVHWVLPTLLVKGIMVLVMGLAWEKLFATWSKGWMAAAVLGGIVQIGGYTVVKILYFGGPAAALATLPNITIQTTAAIIITAALAAAITRTAAGRQILKARR